MAPSSNLQHLWLDAIERGRSAGPAAQLEAPAQCPTQDERAELGRTYALMTGETLTDAWLEQVLQPRDLAEPACPTADGRPEDVTPRAKKSWLGRLADWQWPVWTPRPLTRARQKLLLLGLRGVQTGLLMGAVLTGLALFLQQNAVPFSNEMGGHFLRFCAITASAVVLIKMVILPLFHPVKLRRVEVDLWAHSPRAQSYAQARQADMPFLGWDRWSMRHLAWKDGLLKRNMALDEAPHPGRQP